MSVQHYGHIKGRIVDAGLLTVNQVPLANVAMSGSASDVQTGVLPVAQVPLLDASQIATGTMALARLPASSSNIFTAYNVASVSGTNAFPLQGNGSFLGHNRDSRGLTCLANVPAAGPGGWEFVSYTSTGTFNTVSASLTSTGGLSVNSLAVGSSSLTAGGNMYLGGWLQLAQGTQTGGAQLLLSSTSSTQTHRLSTRHYATSATGNAIDLSLWNYGTDLAASPGTALALSITPVGVGINNTPNPGYGVDCNGSGNFNGMVRGLASGLLMRVFDESATSFPSSGALPEVFAGRPIDTQLLQSITFPQTNSGGGMVAGYSQNYSCRISGYIKAPVSDTYVLSVYTDDGTRIWVNNAKVLDSWQVQGATVTSASFPLGTAWVPFTLEYVQAGYASGLTVQWRGASSNTSLTPFSNSPSGFQFACDMYENPGTQFGTSRTSGKALFSGNVGFGGRTVPAVAVDVLGSVLTSSDSLVNGALVGNWGAAGKAAFGYGGTLPGTTALASTEYAVSQTSTGCTFLNSKAGQGVVFQDGGGAAQMTYVNGQLRIGDGMAPRSTLDVAGVTRLASGQGSLLIGSGTTGTSSLQVLGSGSVLEAGIAGQAGFIVGESAAVDGVVRVVPTSSTGGTQGRLLLQAGSGSVPGVCVGATNLVGIGTASPSFQLDVAGTSHLGSSVQVDGVTFMNNQNSTCMLALNSSTASVPVATSTTFHGFGMQTGALRYQVPTTGSDSHIFFGATTQLMSVAGSGVAVSVPFGVTSPSTLAATTTTSLGFPGTATKLTAGTGDWLQVNGGGGSTGLVVNYNSQVGIGTTTPKYALDVVGTARVQTTGAPAAFYSMANGQTTNFWYAGSDQNNNYVVYNQGNTGVYLTNGATSWSSNSDARLKTDVQSLPPALDTIDRIRPVSFHWKKPGHALEFGVIAQELEDVLPELVDQHLDDADGFVLGVRYQQLIPFLVRGIQELRAEVRGLRALLPDGQGPTPARAA